MLVNTKPNGIIEICEIVNNRLFIRRYVGYTEKQAIQKFKKDLNEGDKIK